MSIRPIALDAAAGALANVGVVEVGENRGKWVEMYQAAVGIPPGSPWCAAFVRFRFEKSAEKLDKELPEGFPDSGWVPSYEAWAKREGLWIPVATARQSPTVARPGDLCCFWFAASNRCAHIGIVVEAGTESGFVSVEGNTGPDKGSGVERDGDGVYRKRRRWSALGIRGGIIRLNF
jgi:hypothetical protein